MTVWMQVTAEELGTLDSSQQTLTTNGFPAALVQAQLAGVPSVGVLSRHTVPMPDGNMVASRASHSEYSDWMRVVVLLQPEAV